MLSLYARALKRAAAPRIIQFTRSVSIGSEGPWIIDDDMSSTHVRLLETTLESHLPHLGDKAALTPGAELPPGSHLVFFNHQVAEPLLGKDGYDDLQAPLGISDDEAVVLRRWYGGSVEFSVENFLKLGEPAVCEESIESVKTGPRGHRVSVTILRQLRALGSTEWAIRERRSLFYIGTGSSLLDSSKKLLTRQIEPNYKPEFSLDVVATRTLMFRYSALCFNAHKIHYDTNYIQTQEGLPDVIVQGPLMVTLVLRWLATSVLATSGRRIRQFDYRNVAPVLVNEKMTFCATRLTENTLEAWITNEAGYVALTGRVIVS